MADEPVVVDVADGVAVVTLSRPDQLNAFSGRMGDLLGRAYAACDADDTVRAVVVTGTGRAFCAGADLEPAGDTFAVPNSDDFSASPVHPPAWDVRKPVLAAINGHAIGIGLTLAMQCDLRLVAEDAKLGFVHVRRGVIPDAHAHWTVPRAVGFARAADLLLTGRTFRGREAVELGLANRALPPDEVLPATLEIARDIAVHTAPLSVALSKRLLWASPTPRPRRGRPPRDRVPPPGDGHPRLSRRRPRLARTPRPQVDRQARLTSMRASSNILMLHARIVVRRAARAAMAPGRGRGGGAWRRGGG